MSNTSGKRSVRQMRRRQIRRVLNGSPEFFTRCGVGNTARKGWGGGLTKTNIIDRSVEA